MVAAVANDSDHDGDDIGDDETMMTMTSYWPSQTVTHKHHQSSKPPLCAWFVGNSL